MIAKPRIGDKGIAHLAVVTRLEKFHPVLGDALNFLCGEAIASVGTLDPGVIPKKIYVNDALVDGVICVTEKGDFSSFDALIPSCLI